MRKQTEIMKCNFCYLTTTSSTAGGRSWTSAIGPERLAMAIRKKMLMLFAMFVLFGMSGQPVVGYSSDPHLFENKDGYIIGNYLHASEQDIRDFFWTGSGDGPALNPFDRFPISEDAIIKTATVVATVYIDRSNGDGEGAGRGQDDLCIFDCPPGRGGGPTGSRGPPGFGTGDHSIDNVTPTDRRYWLMTVVGGMFGKKDYPELEGKLAKLYRVAFSRQQALHLGINNNTLHLQSPAARAEILGRLERVKRRTQPDGQEDFQRHHRRKSQWPEVSRRGDILMASSTRGRNVLVNEKVFMYERYRRRRRKKIHKRDVDGDGGSGDVPDYDLPEQQENSHWNQSHQQMATKNDSQTGDSEKEVRLQQLQSSQNRSSSTSDSAAIQEDPNPDDGGSSRTRPLTRNYDKDAYSRTPTTSTTERQVRILIHNTTHLRESDLDEDGGGGIGMDGGDSNRSNQLLNQTEIIYSVFVGGQPVLATTAAEDMKLLSQEEMERVMQVPVYLKADPYLKEPQATPLIPSTHNGNSNVIALIGENPTVFAVSCVAATLFLVLLIGIFLVARGKRKHISELKKLESTQALVMPGGGAVDDLHTGRSESGSSHLTPYSRDPSAVSVIGSMQPQKPSPTIHFPLPPMSRPTSSSSYSSDSSVYYPKRKLKHHTQELLDERAVTLTNKLQKQFGALAVGTENVYASVQKPKKEHPHKRRRKYLGSENRVGSFEEAQGGGGDRHHLSPAHLASTSNSEQSYDTRPEAKGGGQFEHNETFNTDVIMKHYLKKKTGHYNGGFTMEQIPVEAYNKDRIRCLASVDTGSIGSYLSMASVKSFPRCFVPEPLSRVLEPVTMTHLDTSEGYNGDGGKSTTPGTASTSQYNTDTEIQLSRTQSDGADPGVVGPIVWQMHKKDMEEITSPMRDPVVTRNRFEGLLEGAIQLYSEPVDREEANKNSIPLPGVIRPPPVEHRGKSAAVVRETSRACSATVRRPVTAASQQQARNKLESSGPPSPGRGAWNSGAHSPLVRPMSAGPFHTPKAHPQMDITRVVAPASVLQSTELSAAPLLQNIMHELKRFQKE
ncbi:uncharacterized protein LOC129757748 isoform X2 [Uranotaenia lowii]|uniref:uncharacterized protein LOC129757748 isoform X2 n=1 Tax=Uranotaenia lowii TaxID=190385 RepID=UPI0024783F6F|nr:uncharacterized protein LOC129757748 isoform X2 [Uranotaenia lowii]